MKDNQLYRIYADNFKLSERTKEQFHIQILSWVDSIQSVLFLSGKPKYEIHFLPLADGEVLCKMSVSLKFKTWTSTEKGKTVEEAFKNALNLLKTPKKEVPKFFTFNVA